MRRFISTAVAILLTATACGAPEKTETSCPRPDDLAQLLRSAQIILPNAGGNDSGIFFLDVAPDSFWACVGIQANDSITEINSRSVPEGPEIREALELITQDAPLEFGVRNSSGDRRIIAVR